MYRRVFLSTCLVVLSLLISSGTMAQEPATFEQDAGSSQVDSLAPDDVYSVDASMSSAFTYQGRLKKDGSPVNGTCTMTFQLWDKPTGGVKLGEKSLSSVAVNDGLFTVTLDFGSNAFDGQKRYLFVAVQCPAGTGAYVALLPYQELLASPHAIHAQHASALSAPDGTPLNAATVDVNGSLYVAGYDFGINGRGGGVGNNGGLGRALVDGGAAQGLVINWANDFGKVAINGNVGIGTSSPLAKLDIAAQNDAVHINSQSAGIVVQSAHDGIIMNPVQGYGINIRKANHGVQVTEAAGNGVWAATTNAAGQWGFYTPDKIYGQNVTLSTLTLIAQVAGPAALSIGDVVAVVGLAEPSDLHDTPVPLVRLAKSDDLGGAIGVVESRMINFTETGSAREADAETVETMRGAPGLAETGDRVAITVFGVAQVNANASSEPIRAGQRLTAAETAGHVRPVRQVEVQGVMLAEGAPVLGVALQDLEAGQDMLWVFVNPQ